MKKILLFIAVLCIAVGANAQTKTSSLQVNGGTKLTGDRSAFLDFYRKTRVDTLTTVTFTLRLDPSPITTVADATTYYWGSLQSAGTSTTTAATRQFVIPFNCTLVGFSLATRSTAVASNESHSLYVRVNNTTDITLSTAITFAVGGSNIVNYFSSSSLNTNINAGDKLEMKYVSATSATDPTSAYLSTILYFKSR